MQQVFSSLVWQNRRGTPLCLVKPRNYRQLRRERIDCVQRGTTVKKTILSGSLRARSSSSTRFDRKLWRWYGTLSQRCLSDRACFLLVDPFRKFAIQLFACTSLGLEVRNRKAQGIEGLKMDCGAQCTRGPTLHSICNSNFNATGLARTVVIMNTPRYELFSEIN